MTRMLVLIAALAAACGSDEHRARPRLLPGPCRDGTCQVVRDPLPAPRGDIVDRNGVVLATTRPASDVYVTPSKLDTQAHDALIRTLGLDADEVARLDATIVMGDRKRARVVLEDASADRVQRLQQAALPGVDVWPAPHRVYPQGALAAHAIGYTTALVPEEVDRLAALAYDPGDRVGRYGVEGTWDTYLRGKTGQARRIVDANGQPVDDAAVVARLIDGAPRIEPLPGKTLVLTIDARLQRLAEQAVASYPAAAVVIVEVDTGRILALVSHPSFDPGALATPMRAADLAALQGDPNRPFIDRTTSQAYPPGATYQFVTAIAALEDGVADPGADTRQLAERIGLDRMSEVARGFGFGAPPGLDLNGAAAGRVPTKAWYTQRGSFQIGDTLDAAIGQGDVEVTVLQVAMAYATLAGDGTRHVPQLVERVTEPGGAVVATFDPVIAPAAAPPEVLDVIRRGMKRTGKLVAIAGQSAAVAKHAWFAGWAPADHPEVAIAVLIEHGGDVAAPVARTILEGWWTDVRAP